MTLSIIRLISIVFWIYRLSRSLSGIKFTASSRQVSLVKYYTGSAIASKIRLWCIELLLAVLLVTTFDRFSIRETLDNSRQGWQVLGPRFFHLHYLFVRRTGCAAVLFAYVNSIRRELTRRKFRLHKYTDNSQYRGQSIANYPVDSAKSPIAEISVEFRGIDRFLDLSNIAAFSFWRIAIVKNLLTLIF